MSEEGLFQYRARCVRVVDGDTVDLQIDLGFHMTAALRVRLLGVDTPELNASDADERSRAAEAKQFLVATFGVARESEWPLRVRTQKADSFGRWLADLWVGESGLSVNGELLRLGLAREYRR